MAKLIGIVAVIRVLHLQYRFGGILCSEYFAVFVAYAVLCGGCNGHELIAVQGKQLVVGSARLLQHGLRLVAGKAEIAFAFVLENRA